MSRIYQPSRMIAATVNALLHHQVVALSILKTLDPALIATIAKKVVSPMIRPVLSLAKPLLATGTF